MAFPTDTYTPFGYLANPDHRAASWTHPEGGLLRSFDEAIGFGWVEPTARNPTFRLGIALVVRWNDRIYQSRADFARLGLNSRHHTAQLFTYNWQQDFVEAELAFALAAREALVAQLVFRNRGALRQELEVALVAHRWGEGAAWDASFARTEGWYFTERGSSRSFRLALAGAAARPLDARSVAELAPGLSGEHQAVAGFALSLRLDPEDAAGASVALLRDGAAAATAARWAGGAAELIGKRREADAAFYAGAALPVGDWPGEWKRGWVYDVETTRACIFPPGGVFRDPWPSWMISWPRVVVAEGCLDAARLSYAVPDLARSLARSLFVNATAPNVPCVFQGGEPNMVAKDGTVCGTSPAWCLPFYNLWLLYRRTGDRAWLAELLPRLEAYVDYWLRERTDDEGWVVYKCTWEAGEDCSPRLDPAEEGDEVVSRYVRPVELQATLSQSAAILAYFGRELGDPARAARWDAVAADYAARTQRLWDPAEGRFRDWDKRRGDFLHSAGQASYWKADPVRFSPLSLTPIVAGLTDAEQRTRLRAEIEYYDAAPWCLWPSWSFVIAEAATTAAWYDFAGRFAERIVDRVYRANDRRSLTEAPRPTPGTAPEYWPLDLADFNGSDGYGWGATTSSLWMRQIFGFLDGVDLAELSFTLAPSLPAALLQPGRCYGFTSLPYRGHRVDLTYEVSGAGLDAILRTTPAMDVQATAADGTPIAVAFDAARGAARFPLAHRQATKVVLEGKT